jgi:hypothetical protein
MKTFLLMLGSAFCGALLFAAAVYGYFWWQVASVEPGVPVRFPPRGEKTVAAAPPVADLERFYGTHGSFAGEFPGNARQTVLAAGAGRIAGRVTSDAKPLQGLRLRLALNGAVMSQWTTSGADGRYEVALPYGKYRVNGYELDSSVAHQVLAGKTDAPRHGLFHEEVIAVEAGRPGQGPDFAFVAPVRKLGPRGDVSLAGPVIASWQPYPGAAAYRLQLTEQRDPGDYENQRHVFEWRERPVVSGTSADLAALAAGLKKDHYYTLEVEALDDRRRALSQSPRHFGRADFRVLP